MGTVNVSTVVGETEYLYEDVVVPMQHLVEADVHLYEQQMAILEHLLAEDAAGREERSADIRASAADVEEAMAEYEHSDMSGREEALQRFDESYALAVSNWEEIVRPMSEQGDPDLIEAHDELIDSAFGEAGEALSELTAIEVQAAADGFQHSKDVAASGRSQALVLLVVAILGALGLGLAVARLIGRPLRDTVGWSGPCGGG